MRTFIIAALLAVGLCGATRIASADTLVYYGPAPVAAPVVEVPVYVNGVRYVDVVRYFHGRRIVERREIRREIRHDRHDRRGRR